MYYTCSVVPWITLEATGERSLYSKLELLELFSFYLITLLEARFIDIKFNPLVPSVLYIERLDKILISIMEGILKKNPMSVATMIR